MAKYTITHSCGHTSTVQIGGTVNSRDGQVARLESQPCWECQKQAASQAAAAKATDMALPALTGTPKQVAWAETIRIDKVRQLQALKNTINADAPESDKLIAIIDARVAKTNATYWIDNREHIYSREWLTKTYAAAA